MKVPGSIAADACLIVVTSCGVCVTMEHDKQHLPRHTNQTTPIEDGTNMCWASGPAGKSDGCHDPREKGTDIWIGVEHSWPREDSGCSVRRQYTENSARSPTQKETGCSNSTLQWQILLLMCNSNTSQEDSDNDTRSADGTNMCKTSGPASVSDGVMSTRKRHGNLERW